MIRFCSLGSGSSGNALVVTATSGITTTRLLVDAGFSLREVEVRLQRAGLEPSDLDAVFVTHEHGDHIGCALALAERYDLAVYMSRGTWRAIGPAPMPARLSFARDGERIAIGDIEVVPFTVPHDAAEPLQLRCSDGDACLGVLTDLGSITPHLLEHIAGCEALVLECNHDGGLLAASRYPASLKSRIGGRFGHLSNATAAEILSRTDNARLDHVVAAHLSRENNSPALVELALAPQRGRRDGDRGGLVIADPMTGFGWLQIG